MKLATLKSGGRDGTLVVVSRDLAHARPVPDIAPTLQQALDRWAEVEAPLRAAYDNLNGRARADALALNPDELAAPLPRAYQWADGSAYVNHVELVRKARGAELPENFWTDPLMYQGGSDGFLGPTDPILVADERLRHRLRGGSGGDHRRCTHGRLAGRRRRPHQAADAGERCVPQKPHPQ